MPELFKELEDYSKGGFFAMVDRKVADHLPEWVKASSHVFWLDHPESQKNLQVFGEACSFFLKMGIRRQSKLIAIGGGATTDLAGFVAASVLRGVSWVSIPTTMLAMVDGAIGGKVAINMPEGKNLVGAFHAPEQVLICDEFLTTLPEEEWLSGKGEVIKYGFLSQKIHQLIIDKADASIVAWECALHKKTVVERDFKETGERILLNLGHTLGHAFESSLKIPHGLSVILGMKTLFNLYELKAMEEELRAMLKALDVSEKILELSNYALDKKAFFHYLEQDKKRTSQEIRLILPSAIGDCRVHEVKFKDLLDRLRLHDNFKN
jgi:3-dehydroquinate synthase